MSLPLSHSLRGRLLWLLLVAIIFTAGAQAIIAYRTALAEADVIFDYQMQQMALSLRPGLSVKGELAETFDKNDDENFDFVIQVWSADGVRVFQSTRRAELPQRVQDTAQNADSCAPVALYGVKAAPEAVYAT